MTCDVTACVTPPHQTVIGFWPEPLYEQADHRPDENARWYRDNVEAHSFLKGAEIFVRPDVLTSETRCLTPAR